MVDWIGLGEKVSRAVSRRIIPPIKADATYLQYDDATTPPRSSVIFITPYPCRYFAEIELTNNSNAVAYIKRITLSLNGAEPMAWSESKPIRLEPGEPKSMSVVFPVSRDHSSIRDGDFVLEITPAIGRATKIKGRMPLDQRND